MPKLWFFIGLISLLVGLALYLDQEIRLHASWSWDQFLHHESFIAIAGSIGIVLLVVAVFDYMGRKKR